MRVYTKCDLLRKYSKSVILPSSRQLREWRVSGGIKERIKSGQIDLDFDLGFFTGSFITGLRDSGVFGKPDAKYFCFAAKSHKELALDLSELKLPIKLSRKYSHGQINISKCSFLRLTVRNGIYNWNEYFGGLFTGCGVEKVEGKEWMVISPKSKDSFDRIVSALRKHYVWHEIKEKGIYVSPFYGALFFGFMPIHSASRAISLKSPAKGPELALVYWDMLREKGQPVAPVKAHILPFAKSYATHWNTGLLKKTDIRHVGVEMGIFDISPSLRNLMKDWISYHS
jgi:hypothetical protein